MDGTAYMGLDVHLRTIHGAVVTATGADTPTWLLARRLSLRSYRPYVCGMVTRVR
ncbi:hypothetical protein BH24CHL3_BH24CHL3_02590 [soil metagenome]